MERQEVEEVQTGYNYKRFNFKLRILGRVFSSSIFHLKIIGGVDIYHVGGLGVEGEEVQESPGLLYVVGRVRPQRMHQVRKLEAVADEEHLRVIIM